MNTLKINTLKLIMMLCMLSLIYSCSSDDDSVSEPTALELLTTDKWYFESATGGTISACQKNDSYTFMANGNVTLEIFDDSSGFCELVVTGITTYTLNSLNIDIYLPPDSMIGVIDITSDTLTISNAFGSITLDRIQG